MVDNTEANIRTCPSCGRRVPRKVATCRCGAGLPPDVGVASNETPEASSNSSIVAAIGFAVLLLGGFLAYRMMVPVPTASTEAPAATPGGVAATRKPEDAPVQQGGDTSAARREWDLSANLKSAIPTKPTDTAADKTALEDIISGALPAIVRIETPEGSGSGFYVKNDTLITNRHVVVDNTEVTVRRGDGSAVKARVDQKGADVDVAILKVVPEPNQAVIPMGTSVALRLGQEVILIGSPFGVLQNSVSRGIVSAMRESEGVSLVQTDAAANPGNSGGPMLDRSGAVVGITTMSYKGSQGVNFAVAIDHARSMIEGRGTMVKAAPAQSPNSIGASPARPAFTEPSTPAQFESDRVRDEAQKGYEQMLDQVSKDADTFDTAWKRFKDQCYAAPINGSFAHEWFALLDDSAMPGVLGKNCGPSLSELKSIAERFRDAMRKGEDAARRAGVFPGTLRDARRARRLEFAW